MARKNNRPQDHIDDRLMFENADLKDRLSRSTADLRSAERRVERLLKVGNAMHAALVKAATHPLTTADWEAAVK